MAVDKKEEARSLTDAKRCRLQVFAKLSDEMVFQGFRPTELTVGIVRANVVAMIAAVPLTVAGIVLFVLVNQGREWGFGMASWPLLMVVVLALVVVHEGIHGLVWSLFAPNHLADIEFGFMKEYLTPYCTCKRPLRKWPYIAGALAPLVVLGIIPTAVAIAMGSFELLIVGLIMIISAGGDMMIVWMILQHHQTGTELLVLDHPTQAGSVLFER